MIPRKNEPNASWPSSAPSAPPAPSNERRRKLALELLAHYTQLLRAANSSHSSAAKVDAVDHALQVASDLDAFLTQAQLSDTDLARASAIYACPPLLELASTSARNLYLRTVLTNRDLPDSTWRALVARYPAETSRLLPLLSSVYTAASTLSSSVPAFMTLSPSTPAAEPPPLPHPTPLLLPRLATARLLMLNTPQLSFSLFVSKHLPALVSAAAAADHVELALLCLLVPGAPEDRVKAVVDALVRNRVRFDGVSEGVAVAAAMREPRVAEAVVEGGGRVAGVVLDRLGIK